MNLGTVGLILTSLAALFTILASLYKGVRINKARSNAQQCRITCLIQIVEIQGERLTTIEMYLAKEDAGNYQINSGLINLEEKALTEYKRHDTNLT
jgi:hypothetical protein